MDGHVVSKETTMLLAFSSNLQKSKKVGLTLDANTTKNSRKNMLQTTLKYAARKLINIRHRFCPGSVQLVHRIGRGAVEPSTAYVVSCSATRNLSLKIVL